MRLVISNTVSILQKINSLYVRFQRIQRELVGSKWNLVGMNYDEQVVPVPQPRGIVQTRYKVETLG